VCAFVALAIVLLVVTGIGMAGIGMSVMHDAVHGSYSSKKWVNSLMGATIYLLGSCKTTWMTQHNYLHHSYTNITGYDEDIETKGFVRLSQHARWRKYHRLQHLYAFLFYGLMTLAKFIGDFTQLIKYRKKQLPHAVKGNPAYELIRISATKAIYLAVAIGLPILVTDYTWWQVLIGFAIVHLTGGMIMSTIFQMAHVVEGTDQPLPDSEGLIHNDWMVHQLSTTSDFARTNKLLGWYIGGLNFQIEHHLFPNICHVHYKRIAPIVQRTAREFGFTYNVKLTFAEALQSHLRTLKRLGKEPGKAQDAEKRSNEMIAA
jgi:linoleoyl-CoA desaturase